MPGGKYVKLFSIWLMVLFLVSCSANQDAPELPGTHGMISPQIVAVFSFTLGERKNRSTQWIFSPRTRKNIEIGLDPVQRLEYKRISCVRPIPGTLGGVVLHRRLPYPS